MRGREGRGADFELDIWTSHLEMQIFSWKSHLVQESRSPTGLDGAGRGQL